MDMESHTRFVVTAWRNSQELLQLRQDLYGSETHKKEKAVNRVFVWRSRKPDGLPILLDSTADIVDVILQDERGGLKHNALRLLYATAIMRFITGLADTQLDLTRDRPSWFPPGKSFQLPLSLLETRHRIVHRHLPSLAELKRAATESLEWLWEWYWAQLDPAFKSTPVESGGEELGVESRDAVRERLQAILKTYVKERKSEIKTRKKDSKAAETALSSYNLRFSPTSTTTPSSDTQRVLLHLLVDEKMILPTDKKLGTTMSGAFLIWTPFLHSFCSEPAILSLSALFHHLLAAMNKPSSSWAMVNPEMDPVKEGLHDWILHILTSPAWTSSQRPKYVDDTLGQCFSDPTFWNLKVAAAVLEKGEVGNKEMWHAVLDAARKEDEEMDVDVDGDVEGIETALSVGRSKEEGGGVKAKEKIRGPTKVLAMWKAKPIGWLPEGWEDDE